MVPCLIIPRNSELGHSNLIAILSLMNIVVGSRDPLFSLCIQLYFLYI